MLLSFYGRFSESYFSISYYQNHFGCTHNDPWISMIHDKIFLSDRDSRSELNLDFRSYIAMRDCYFSSVRFFVADGGPGLN